MENGMESNKKTIYRSRIDWWLPELRSFGSRSGLGGLSRYVLVVRYVLWRRGDFDLLGYVVRMLVCRLR